MKVNQPVTQREIPFPKGKYLVSKTDLKGIITHANDAFVELSGLAREELVGRNHNVVRHPDMPPAAFAEMWRTIEAGYPWRGIVKNRAKNGDHYWVDALIVPILEDNHPVGYMSVRSEPSREAVAEADALYRKINQRKTSLDGRPSLAQRITIRARLVAIMAFMALLLVGGAITGLGGMMLTDDDLREAYEEHLAPSVALARIVERLGDSRAEVMLALQHNPAATSATLHEHEVVEHAKVIERNLRQVAAMQGAFDLNLRSVDTKALAKALLDAGNALSTDGVNATMAAIEAGDYDRANQLVATKVDPLYREVQAHRDALQMELARSGAESYATAQQRFHVIRLITIAGASIALLLVGIATFLLLRAIVDPLQRVIGHFNRIAEGNLTEVIDIRGRDEAGVVLTQLASMQVQLKAMLDEVQTASKAIETQAMRVGAQTAAVFSQSEQQRDRGTSIAAATQEFAQSVNQVADSAGKTAEAAQAAQGQVADAQARMERSTAATHRVVEAVEASSRTIDDLNRAVAKIGAISEVIREIADQTNLLALNAAIEAARAGEAGRGFAVVAEEVRNLAERTSRSTTDITMTIAEIRKVTGSAVDSMNHAVTEVQEGIGMIQDSVAGLSLITTTSHDVTVKSLHIADAAREQAIASDEVATNMERIATLIDSNLESAREAKLAADNLDQTAKSLRQIVGRFKLIG